MGRQIITENDLLKIKSSKDESSRSEAVDLKKTAVDNYMDRLLKYIPAEIVAVYIFVESLILKEQSPEDLSVIYWIVFIAFAVLTPLYLWRILKVTKVIQLIISMLSFVVWVFAIGGPFILFGWYKSIYGAIILPIFILAVAIINPEE